MQRTEFSTKLFQLVAEWSQDYLNNHLEAEDKSDWPITRDEEEWMQDFVCWLECKGMIV